MAKSKADTSKAPSKTAESKKSEAAPKPAPKAAAAKKTVAKPAAPLLTDDEIGPTAGLVWQTLNDQGAQTVAALKKSVDAPGDLVMAAVGWLAREGKLEFETSGRTVKISLR
ncbi:winged helix-turn-helix domain-containing protein [Aeoliella sp. SH292]|uniref:winged helix-turn-helix domain-containing protein n=1 Tax=Aeoliella sp. SH292 TaxID=3454464 RepID=UPI003F9DDBFD